TGNVPTGSAGRDGSAARGILFCVLQHWRTQHPRPLRSVDGPALHHAQRIALLDCGESTVEDSGRALFRRTVAVPPGIFANLSAGAIFVLLRGIAASGTHTRGCGQLPGTGVLDRDRGISAGRDSPANTNDRNRDCTVGDHRSAVAGSEVS